MTEDNDSICSDKIQKSGLSLDVKSNALYT
jgi:hypothetical protein